MTRGIAAKLATPLILVSALLASCSSTPEAGPSLDSASIKAKAEAFREQGRSFLADLFRDGIVDADDYDAAFAEYRACMTSRGYDFSAPIVSPADGLRYIASFESEGKTEEQLSLDGEECASDLAEVEAMYTATTEQVMAPELRTKIISCLVDRGLEIDATARNYPEMVGSGGQAEDWHQGLSDCLGSARHELYPDLPYLPVGF